MTARIVATSALPGPHLAALSESFAVEILTGEVSPEELRVELADAEALITLLSVPVDDETLSAAPRLKIVANYAVGVDNIDLKSAARRGIAVTHTPGVLTDATADLTLAMILALSRRLIEGDRLVRVGGFSGWKPDLLLGRELKGRVLGIVGPGRIGRAVAKRARACGMTVVAFARSARDQDDPDDPTRVSFDDLLARSDVISIHLPLTPETHHLIGASAFSRMKPGSILINTARGPIVDEAALCRALDEGLLAGAALDVYEREPHIAPALLDDDRVLLLPHMGSATLEARSEMSRMVCEDIARVLTGERPRWPAPGP